MKTIHYFFGLLLAVGCCGMLSAQYKLTPAEFDRVPVAQMPAQDNDALLAAEMAARRPGRANTFAVSLATKIRPGQSGIWTREGGLAVWRQRILSPGAKSLNLGFSEFSLPAGGELYLVTADDKLGPFTPADNEDHNQLWTPILEGDELMVELRVPPAAKDRVQLFLTMVNHDFAGVLQALPAACNVDVVCGAADGWEIVDRYRDIIRSVAAYTIGGTNICSGALVNNVNQDGRPFFLTADHCGVTGTRAPALVAYWNYENSVCREVVPGSGTNSPNSDGRRNVFNSGATLRATFGDTDFTLIEFDDPINPAANAFFAGWSAEDDVPTDTIIGIHHPGVQEKRISFTFNDMFRTFSRGGGAPDPEGNHIEVPDWDIGTTEGGSSGSPIFDRFKRLRGQLFGGRAACTNDLYDVYGFLHSSWTGGGTPDSRLMDWLDPCGTGTLTIDGFDSAQSPTTLTADTYCAASCTTQDNDFTFMLGSGFPAGSPVTISSSTAGIAPTLSVTSAAGGDDVTVSIPGSMTTALGVYEIVVSVGNGATMDDITFLLDLNADGPSAAPTADSPADAATDVSPRTLVSWNDVPDATGYDFQLATDAAFSNILTDVAMIEGTTANISAPLSTLTTYFWRVRTINACGPGAWTSYSFTTSSEFCAAIASADTPVEISGDGSQTVFAAIEVENGTMISDMEVILELNHSFVGDLNADLEGPDGTTIRLFDEIRGGGCPGNDMSVTFSTSATRTAMDFVETCEDAVPTVSGTFQPAESFAVFTGTSSEGTWALILRDNADQDAGSITSFSINFCGAGDGMDFSLRSNTNALEVCPDEATTVQLTLGTDFADEAALAVTIDDEALSNFTTGFDVGSRIMNVDFTSWPDLAAGTYQLTFTVTNTDGTERSLNIPLTVKPAVAPAIPTSPEDGITVMPGEVAFNWDVAAGATNYTLEYSLTEDFATVEFSETTDGTLLTLSNLPTGQPIYWRVIANGDCGNVASTTQVFTIESTGLQEFGQGRTLNIYPNPVKDLLTVEAAGNWSGEVKAGLFDAAGRYLRTYSLNGAGEFTWPLGKLAAGVYYLRFEGAGTRRTERLVVLP